MKKLLKSLAISATIIVSAPTTQAAMLAENKQMLAANEQTIADAQGHIASAKAILEKNFHFEKFGTKSIQPTYQKAIAPLDASQLKFNKGQLIARRSALRFFKKAIEKKLMELSEYKNTPAIDTQETLLLDIHYSIINLLPYINAARGLIERELLALVDPVELELAEMRDGRDLKPQEQE